MFHFSRSRIPSYVNTQLSTYWIVGLFALLFWVADWLLSTLRVQGKNQDYSLYVLIGTIFPALALSIMYLTRNTPSPPVLRVLIPVFNSASVAFCLAVLWSGRNESLAYVLLLASVQTLAMNFSIRKIPNWAVLGRKGNRWAWIYRSQPIIQQIQRFLIAAISWALASKVVFPPLSVRFHDVYLIVALTAAFFVPIIFKRSVRVSKSKITPRPLSNCLWIFAGALVFALGGLRTTELFTFYSFHHWGVYLAPIDMVRHGGWLLWDTPSQYGFLNVLLISILPVSSTWYSVYLANAAAHVVTGLILFHIMRGERASAGRSFLALFVSFCALFIPGMNDPNHPYLRFLPFGPQLIPAEGPLRFIWAYILVFIVYRAYQKKENGYYYRTSLLWGDIAWVLGSLWSVESAFFCLATWLPARVLMVLRERARVRQESEDKTPPFYAFSYLMPICFFVITFAVIQIFYWVRLGHGPDWTMFFDFAHAVNSEILQAPMEKNGTIGILVWLFLITACAVAWSLRGWSIQRPAILCASALGMIWATSSYFVVRSIFVVISQYGVICTLVVAILLVICRREAGSRQWSLNLRSALVPFMIVGIVLYWGTADVGYQAKEILHVPPRELESKLPRLPAQIAEQLEVAGVRSDSPVVFASVNFLPSWAFPDGTGSQVTPGRRWLSVSPLALANLLPPDRIFLYLQRYAQRTHQDGWLIELEEKENVYYSTNIPVNGFHQMLLALYTPVKYAQAGPLKMVYLHEKSADRPSTGR